VPDTLFPQMGEREALRFGFAVASSLLLRCHVPPCRFGGQCNDEERGTYAGIRVAPEMLEKLQGILPCKTQGLSLA